MTQTQILNLTLQVIIIVIIIYMETIIATYNPGHESRSKQSEQASLCKLAPLILQIINYYRLFVSFSFFHTLTCTNLLLIH